VKFSPQSALQEGIYFCSTVCRELNVINEEWIDRSYFNVLANFHYVVIVAYIFLNVSYFFLLLFSYVFSYVFMLAL
jgi:hypothetical protein